MNHKFTSFIFAIFIIAISFYLNILLKQSEKNDIEVFNENSSNIIYTSYQSIFNTFKATAQMHNLKISKNNEVLKLLKKFKYAKSLEEKDILRGELYRKLYKEYDYLKQVGIRQFHFHTHKGQSLLRFHKPHLNGDSLIEIRESIKVANIDLKNFYGFEGGRVYPGFRYVFPIIDNSGEHLGSVEFSLPFDVIENELNNVLPKIAYQLHLSEDISYKKVSKDSRSFFKKSVLLKDHYIENISISKTEKKLQKNDYIPMFYENLDTSHIDISDCSNFSLYFIHNKKGYKADFISIKQSENRHGAYLVAYSEFYELLAFKNKYKEFKIYLFLSSMIILILNFIIYYQINKANSQKQEFEKILNYQENIVIQTNNEKLIYGNHSFFKFTGFKDLKSFLKKYDCICELFVENDNFFYVQKNSSNSHWIEQIQTLPKHKQMVGLLGCDFELYVFSVKINKYLDDSYILTFFDISESYKQQLKLEDKTYKDSLTNSLNREYFQQNSDYLIKQYNIGTSKLALAILDIDYFKKVNDTFGHDIGDMVLIEFVDVINKHCRKDDLLIRWGGEEFILILKIKSKQDLEKILEHIRKTIEQCNFSVVKQITCSIGGTVYMESEDIKKTIKRADEALYEAKAAGRNKLIIKHNKDKIDV